MDLIIYHKNCADGFCAAYLAKKRWPKAELIPMSYGEHIGPYETQNKFRGKDVLFVDFSLPREEMDELSPYCHMITVYDHHKTAEAALAKFPNTVFDMERSGAAITWDELDRAYTDLNRDEYERYKNHRPWYVDYVQDRDLWMWKLPDSKAVNAYLQALPYTIEAWDALRTICPLDAAYMGKAILMSQEKQVKAVCETAYRTAFCGYDAWLVNNGGPLISEILHELCKRDPEEETIGIGWYEVKDGTVRFSLRSLGNVDVSRIAKHYGGGGHKNAAGFELRPDLTEWEGPLYSLIEEQGQIYFAKEDQKCSTPTSHS